MFLIMKPVFLEKMKQGKGDKKALKDVEGHIPQCITKIESIKKAIADSKSWWCILKFGATDCGLFGYLTEEEDATNTKCIVRKNSIGSMIVTGFYFFASGGVIYFVIKYFFNNDSSPAGQEDEYYTFYQT